MADDLLNLADQLVSTMRTGLEYSPEFQRQFKSTFKPAPSAPLASELAFFRDTGGPDAPSPAPSAFELAFLRDTWKPDEIEISIEKILSENRVPSNPLPLAMRGKEGSELNVPDLENPGKTYLQTFKEWEEKTGGEERKTEMQELEMALKWYRNTKTSGMNSKQRLDALGGIRKRISSMNPDMKGVSEAWGSVVKAENAEDEKIKRADFVQQNTEGYNKSMEDLETAKQMGDPAMIQKAVAAVAGYFSKFKSAGILPEGAHFEDLPGIIQLAKAQVDEVYGRRRAERAEERFLEKPAGEGMPDRGFFYERARSQLSPEAAEMTDPTTGETGLVRAASNLEAQWAERHGRDFGFRIPNPMTEFQQEKTREQQDREAKLQDRRNSLAGLLSTFGQVKLDPDTAAQVSMFGKRYLDTGNPADLTGLKSILSERGEKDEMLSEAKGRALDLIRAIGGSGPA